MNAIKNLVYDIRISHKLKRLNHELYMQDIRDYKRAIYAAMEAIKQDVKACKAYDKAIAHANRKMQSIRL